MADDTPSNGTPTPGNGQPDAQDTPPPIDEKTSHEPSQPRRICGAKNRQGKPCQRSPTPGRNRCKFHGGMTHPGGPGHPTHKTGFYSKLMPLGMRKTYEKVRNDPETLAMAEEIALLKVRIGQLVSQLQTGETSSLWGDLQATYSELSAALQSGDIGSFRSSVEALGRIIQAGGETAELWTELYEAIDKKTEVAAREWKRLVDLRQVITAEKALALITAIMHSVARNVPDMQARIRISNDVRELINRGDPDEVEPSNPG